MGEKIETQALVMFPYSGYKTGSERGEIFWQIIDECREVLNGSKPVVVLNKDTKRKLIDPQEEEKGADAFLKDSRLENVELHETWSTDTCQMWLAGWGYIIDTKDVDRIVLLPGDIDFVASREDFFNRLSSFVTHGRPWDIVLGDFKTSERFSAKELIDIYGTYALLANWFPEVSKAIHKKLIRKVRTEFINIRKEVLRELLDFRKFGYEQTLNMLIRSWNFEKGEWKYKIQRYPLGTLQDDRSFRQYRECLDQIERTERMLRLLWREIHDARYREKHQQFIDDYARRDRRSTSIRENARITIRDLL